MADVIGLGSTITLPWAANDSNGAGADPSTVSAYVRLCGTTASSTTAPITSGVTAYLLTHSDYPAGAGEVSIAATEANGFTASQYYGVYLSAGIGSYNPTGALGKIYVTTASKTPYDAAARTIDALNTDGAKITSGQSVSTASNAPSAAAITTAILEGDWSSYEVAAKNTTSSKVGHALAGVRSMALGRLAISGTTLTVYEADGTTALATFTLASDYSARSAPS